MALSSRAQVQHSNTPYLPILGDMAPSLVHWLDDEVFEQCPTWEACEQAGKIPRLDLERYFGKANENGPGNYAQSAKYGVGRRVLCNILEGTESEDSIAEAIRELPPTARRKRGIELEIQEAKQEAEAQRQEAARLEEEQKKLAEQVKQADQKKKEELKKAQQQKEKQAAAAKEKAAKKVAHTHEVVYSLVHWLDDEVFEQCPTWEACEMAGKIPRHDLERYFGEADQGGPGNYEQCVQRGVGRRVVAKILAGAESDGDIRKAIDNFPMSERHRASRQHLYNNSTVHRLMYNFRGSKSCTRCGTRQKVA